MQAGVVKKPQNPGIFLEKPAQSSTKTVNSRTETGLYYYGARYLDPKTSRWISADPAMGEYIPLAPINDDAKKHNKNLPGMGGIYNTVNMHCFHYAGNNPVKLIDPDGKTTTVTITNQKVNDLPQEFKEKHGLIGSGEMYVVNSNGQTIMVDTYLVTMTDDKTNITSYYEVTRHAPDKNNLKKLAFNPKEPVGKYYGWLLDIGDGVGLKLELWNDKSGTNRNVRADITGDGNPDFVQIHVGGHYTNSKDGTARLAGSLGCFGLNGKDAGNKGRDAFVKDIQTRHENSGGRIEIHVQKIE